jgi:hypothetical protein
MPKRSDEAWAYSTFPKPLQLQKPVFDETDLSQNLVRVGVEVPELSKFG